MDPLGFSGLYRLYRVSCGVYGVLGFGVSLWATMSDIYTPYIYIYIHTYIHTYIYIYIYIHVYECLW